MRGGGLEGKQVKGYRACVCSWDIPNTQQAMTCIVSTVWATGRNNVGSERYYYRVLIYFFFERFKDCY